jgi:MerR family transcriptional regulator, light-induced transcriptional regulator
MRIGELSRRTGVSPELLRAWERRYGLLQPSRSEGGFRLYSSDDEARVRRTTAFIADGLSAAEAARQAIGSTPGAPMQIPPLVDELATRLRFALDDFESYEAHSTIDRLLAVTSIEAVVADVFIPYLHDLGERWTSGRASVAQEHFASNLLRGRLLGMTRDWGSGGTSTAVLACLPGESHDLGLMMFGILIARRGWRVTFLGADTPFETLRVSIRAMRPSVVVLASVNPGLFSACAAEVEELSSHVPLAIACGVAEATILATGSRPLPFDIVEAARSLAA